MRPLIAYVALPLYDPPVAAIGLTGISKSFVDGTLAVAELDLEIADGELLAFGPSGCGKSTALRIVAGLETPTEGEVRIGGREVTDMSPVIGIWRSSSRTTPSTHT